jgi:predicted TIM-barrel enzyme
MEVKNMGKRFTRREILNRLKDEIEKGGKILGAGCSAGIIAKCAELGGADLIIVYSTGKSRLRGLPTTMIPNSNPITLEMFDEIDYVVKDTPIIAGIEPYSVLSLMQDEECQPEKDLPGLIRKFIEKGFSGIINFPTIGFIEDEDTRCEHKKKEGGFAKEVEMIKVAKEMGVFTMAYTFYPKDAKVMAEASVDVLVPHCGGTAGGEAGLEAVLKGFGTKEYGDAAKKIQEMINAARSARPDIICLAHGGPFATPKDTKYLYQHTQAQGFVGASSIERIPVERAVKETVEEFKSIH